MRKETKQWLTAALFSVVVYCIPADSPNIDKLLLVLTGFNLACAFLEEVLLHENSLPK